MERVGLMRRLNLRRVCVEFTGGVALRSQCMSPTATLPNLVAPRICNLQDANKYAIRNLRDIRKFWKKLEKNSTVADFLFEKFCLRIILNLIGLEKNDSENRKSKIYKKCEQRLEFKPVANASKPTVLWKILTDSDKSTKLFSFERFENGYLRD